MAYWLMKSEPDTFSIDDLAKRPRKTTAWDGVRNYQARNYMRQMKRGDEVLFYHSSCDEVGVAGIAQVVREAYPDATQFDPDDSHFDPKSDPEDPRWDVVDVKFVKKLPNVISLEALKANSKLGDFALTRRGNRLSVLPVTAAQWRAILKMA